MITRSVWLATAIATVLCLQSACLRADGPFGAITAPWIVSPSHDETDRAFAKELFVLYALEFAAKDSAHPPIGDMKKMVNAAFLTAEAFPDFGPSDFYERAAYHLSYGYGETRWRLGDVSYNLPGFTPGVRHFSVDIWWAGLNEENFRGKDNLRTLAVRLQRDGKLPKNMQLMYPPLQHQFARAHAEYKAQLKAHVKPKAMTFHVRIYEETQDDVTSALIYRIIEERMRRSYGLKQTYYRGASQRIVSYIVNRVHAHGIH